MAVQVSIEGLCGGGSCAHEYAELEGRSIESLCNDFGYSVVLNIPNKPRVYVNGRQVDLSYVLQDGDLLSFLP